jgi:hypothetical protein
MFLLILLICFCSAELRTNYIIDYGSYKLDYNYTIGQANYAIYKPLQTYKGNCYRKMKPGLNYTVSDYTGLKGIDRGHLAPYADIGIVSCIMNNIVPQNSSFNQGKWKVNEQYLRNNYKNHWIVVGCEYPGTTLVHKGKIFYALVGCYYVVFDQDPIHRNAEIIHNGYIGYNANSNELPWWIVKNKSATSTVQITYIWFIVLFSIVSIMLLAAVVIILIPKKL